MNSESIIEAYIPHHASFRDPSGFVFSHQGEIYRQVNRSYRPHYDQLMKSGLYKALTEKRWLVEHTEVDSLTIPDEAYKVLRPTPIPFISYPYEWSFSQLKDAALRTLEIQTLALTYGMTLKDASAYNIQFAQGMPILIDTLSFECYRAGQTWDAYRQFCQHFLAPLALMAMVDRRLLQLMRVHIDGIALDLASCLLPKRSWLQAGLLIHLHLHARLQKSCSNTSRQSERNTQLSKQGLVSIVNSLRKTLKKLDWRPVGTEWADYYQATNYSAAAIAEKSRLVQHYLTIANPKVLWDMGANTGHFSCLAKESAALTLAFDIDEAAVENHYRALKEKQEHAILPLVMDLTNPSPSLGWHHHERMSLIKRGPADCVMALALIHHLAITNHVPLTHIAEFLAEIGRYVIIEFVPKSDSQVQRLLRARKTAFSGYTQDEFEKAFSAYFSVLHRDDVQGSDRVMYLMERSHEKK
ncbi:MAG: SAM-dependent methyltransferase [Gammaproteobacteria bacterium]|nr:SAM-dependent methyltransferase [Gammaproteobacteria bacterium]